jgi:hypothetical protein
MWYHKVSQCTDSDKWLCSAVNYWWVVILYTMKHRTAKLEYRYDMEYAGPFFASINFIRSAALIPSDGGTDKSCGQQM